MNRVAFSCLLFLDYMAANRGLFSDPSILFQNFVQRLLSGTIDKSGNDMSGLYWLPSGRTDKNVGHNCSQKSIKKGLCSGYHYHNISSIEDKKHSHEGVERTHSHLKKVTSNISVASKVFDVAGNIEFNIGFAGFITNDPRAIMLL